MTQLMCQQRDRVSLWFQLNQAEWTQTISGSARSFETPVAHNHLTAYENLILLQTPRQIPNALRPSRNLGIRELNRYWQEGIQRFFSRYEAAFGNCHCLIV